MNKLRLFGMWLWDSFENWIKSDESSGCVGSILTWGFFGGIAFIVADNTSSLEGYRFGWFYSLMRIPSYIAFGGLMAVIVGLLISTIIDWLRDQYHSYQRYMKKTSVV